MSRLPLDVPESPPGGGRPDPAAAVGEPTPDPGGSPRGAVPTVVGLDLSLASTGVAVVGDGIGLLRITSTGRAAARLTERSDRIAALRVRVCDQVEAVQPDLVVVEGPSLGQKRQGGQHDRAGLWWGIVGWLIYCGLPVAEVPPATLKRYATGRGNADKDAVLAAAIRRYPTAEVTGNDQADALILAAMGRDWLGHPIAPVPQTHRAALVRVQWPTPRGAP